MLPGNTTLLFQGQVPQLVLCEKYGQFKKPENSSIHVEKNLFTNQANTLVNKQD